MKATDSQACGFDFGTSNSSIGRMTAGKPALIAIQDGRVSIPTAMFFSFDDGSVTFGREAIARYLLRDEGRLFRSLKSVLGSSLIHDLTQVRTQRLRFSDIIALFIEHVRATAGHPTAVVMGRPVHFIDNNEEADKAAQTQLRAAAAQAGFTDIEFQFEPIAAALDYEQGVSAEQLAFVVDIGGGTSDFSIVRVSPERRGKADRKGDILGTSGVHIGGTDFDRLLNLRTIMPHLGLKAKIAPKMLETPVWWFHDLATWQRISFMYAPKVVTDIRRVRRDAVEPEKLDRLIKILTERKGHDLLASVETAKIELSSAEETTLSLAKVLDIPDHSLTRAQLEAAIGEQVAKVETKLVETLKLSGVGREAIDVVFLTGGSSKLPLLRANLQSHFPKAKIVEGDAFGSVATGLTIEAGTRFGARQKK